MRLTLMAAALAVLFAAPQAKARITLRRSPVVRHSSGVSQRKRLNVNDLIASPGTMEIDWSGLYSYTTSTLTLPSAIRYTPNGNSLLVGQTEYSVGFDSISSVVIAGNRSTQFSNWMTLAATSVVYGGQHFDVAFAPQLTALLRGDSGIRAGATMIARYDGGGNTIGGTASWTGATTASDTNPAGTWDFGVGFGRQLAQKGMLSQFTPHVNLTLEKSTGFDHTLAIFGGIEYQLTERMAIDVSGQRFGLTGGGEDRQVLVGLTINLGKLVK